MRIGRKLATIGLLVALAATGVQLAAAAEVQTDEEYAELAEPVCKRNVEANKRIFKGVKGLVRKGKLGPASRRFFRAARAFNKTIGQLADLPRPESSAARLKRWLGLLRVERNIIKKIGRALAAGKRHKAESYSVSLKRNSNKANNTVLGFDFDYCRIDPSRFG